MRTIFGLVLIVAALALSEETTRAQRSPQVPRIGVLAPGVAGAAWPPTLRQSLLQGLQDLGYVEGRSVIIEYRNAEGRIERLPELAADLVRRKVSVIVTAAPPSVEAALTATRTIPIVMVGAGNPVAQGFVESLSLPGGNVTGLSGFGELGTAGKRLELLTEAFPWIARVALLNPQQQREGDVNAYARAVKALGVNLERVDVHNPTELEPAFSKIRLMRPDALIVMSYPPSTLSAAHMRQIVDFALEPRLPTMYENASLVRHEGGLMSYGANYRASGHRAASYVDKILKGANPAVLPVEPLQFEFVINLKTARTLGVTIPPEILLEADEVIN